MAPLENYTDLQYCASCGSKLVWSHDESQGYNRKTGEKLTDISVYICPKYFPLTLGSNNIEHDVVNISIEDNIRYSRSKGGK